MFYKFISIVFCVLTISNIFAQPIKAEGEEVIFRKGNLIISNYDADGGKFRKGNFSGGFFLIKKEPNGYTLYRWFADSDDDVYTCAGNVEIKQVDEETLNTIWLSTRVREGNKYCHGMGPHMVKYKINNLKRTLADGD